MKISQKGLELIKRFEGCRLKAYQDSVGVWTIGYGTTNADKAITGETICQGLYISQETADEWFQYNEYMECIPSAFDCTGQRFTSWYKLVERNGRWWAYHCISVDV